MGEDKGAGGVGKVYALFGENGSICHSLFLLKALTSGSLHIIMNMILFVHISEFFRTVRPNSLCKYLP